MLKQALITGCLIVVIMHKAFAISPEEFFQPYATFIAILNATTEHDLQQATNGVESLSVRFVSSMSAICACSFTVGDKIRLRWNGAQIGNVDMSKISSRAIWMLNSLCDEDLPNISPGIGGVEEKEIIKRVQNRVSEASFFTMNEKRQALKILSGLTEMATDEDLLGLAEKSDNSAVLDKLAMHDNVAVRMAVVTNQFVSFETLNRLRNDDNGLVASLAKQSFKQKFVYAHDSGSLDQTASIMHAITFSTQPKLLHFAITQLQSMSHDKKQSIVVWLISHLSDLRFSPAPGEQSPPPGHDLSLIGGKCAYLLEKILGEKLVPVRRDTPLGTLEKQRERLMKRVQEMQ